mgnify:CR=1 FL=1
MNIIQLILCKADLQGIICCFGTPRHRNIEPMGGLQKGGKIYR